MTKRTLFAFITCSMEESRAAFATAVAKNISSQFGSSLSKSDFVSFDNASKITDHFKYLPSCSTNFRCSRNIGLWGAIYWILNNAQDIMGRSYDFIYIIESDHIHSDMSRFDALEHFLVANADVGGVRTDEFSVRWRMFYDKRYWFMPFAKRNAWVMQTNQVTGEKVRFQLADRSHKIYRCNFLAKLPSLNRFAAMKSVFRSLQQQEFISELDFMRLYHELYPQYAVVDGGLYNILSSVESPVTGSFTERDRLEEIQYRTTRNDRIETDSYIVSAIDE